MNTPDYDRIRDWVEGRLSPAEAEAFRRELGADPELARATDEFREAHQLTAALEELDARSSTTLADLERRLDEAPRAPVPWRRAAAVAALLLAVAVPAALFFGGDGGEGGARGPVELVAIPRTAPPASEDAAPIPTDLGRYRPVADGEVRWMRDLGEARAAALAAERPVMVFGTYPLCPWCLQMKTTSLKDESVLALVEEYVPVEVDLLNADPELRESLLARGYPFLEVQDGEGRPLYNFSGTHDGEGFRDHLERGLAEGGREDRLEWSDVQKLAELYGSGRTEEDGGRYGEAARAYRDLVARSEGHAFAAAGRSGLARIARRSFELLEEARGASDPEARAILDRGLASFAGTPYAADLAAVRRRLDRGSFPELVWRP